ncbi:hypothetical protein HPP92_012977 [Vanilla planifolia]|uniref:DYW domain-containing protein n=1 Tax=Vanilla planifolia TaxID=51239 RepID=A0A835UWG9_VANPL|nr:hypothetical protein HPP92_013443 [Vanilla planifolia]KAG0478258.1 hypothetical protein HPP92_012977 [Vanilla planifolia]
MTISFTASRLANHLSCKPYLRSVEALYSYNRRLDCLAKAGRLDDARRLFDELPHRDEVSWNTLISAYASAGLYDDALLLFRSNPQLYSSTVPWSSLISGFSRSGRTVDAFHIFHRMLFVGLRPDPYSLGAYIRACSNLPSLITGEVAHSLAIKSSLNADSFVAAALVAMYSNCGQATAATFVFDSVPMECRSNRVLWTSLIMARAHDGDHLRAMELFRLMRYEGFAPNQFTLPIVLTACAADLALDFGRQIHALATHTGLYTSQFVQSSLVNLYAKCSDLAAAKMVLALAEHDDTVSWNSLIVRCSRAALHDDALSLFSEMHRRCIGMDEFSFPSALNSLAAADDLGNGLALHCLVEKTGFGNRQHVGNALVDMYSKCGQPVVAYKLFDTLPSRNVVGWTALYNGYSRHVSDESALRLYCRMRAIGVHPDEYIISSVLSSCADLTLLELGRQVHAVAILLGLVSFRSASNSLITMYAKSGCAHAACEVFNSMIHRDAITWTAMIVGYAQNGRGRDSLVLFNQMVRSGATPDYVTFIGLLFACSHAGMVDVGRAHFDSMEPLYGVAPGPEHYACMVDLLCRGGRVSEGAALLFSGAGAAMADATVWKSLLAGSRVHRDVHVAEWAAGELLRLDPGDATAYVMLSNVYSAAGRWTDVARVRGVMRARGVTKEPGCSWVEDCGRVHVFHVDDRGHPMAAEIYEKVTEMLEEAEAAGYMVDTRWSLQYAAEEEREWGLAHHSEKLAVAFGLLCGPKEKPIRVYKNLRICGDCHTAIKFVAKVYEREIVLRDSNCFHHFSGGNCSCFDYW